MAEVILPVTAPEGGVVAHVVHCPATDGGPCDFHTDPTTATRIALLGVAGNGIRNGLSSEPSVEIAALQGYVKAALSSTLGRVLAPSRGDRPHPHEHSGGDPTRSGISGP